MLKGNLRQHLSHVSTVCLGCATPAPLLSATMSPYHWFASRGSMQECPEAPRIMRQVPILSIPLRTLGKRASGGTANNERVFVSEQNSDSEDVPRRNITRRCERSEGWLPIKLLRMLCVGASGHAAPRTGVCSREKQAFVRIS